MNKVAIIILLLVGGVLNTMSQSLTETEVNETMMKAFSLQQQNNYKDALVAFQKVAESTKGKRTDVERCSYYKSQAMACSCLRVTKQYEKCYNLAKDLLNDSLPKEEKKDIAYNYSFGGYAYGLDIMHEGKSRDYAKARKIFEEILPYSDGDLKKKIASKIPVAWYFEGAEYKLAQNYEKALLCMEKAREGFHQSRKVKDEIQTLIQIGNLKENLNLFFDAISYYNEVLKITIKIGDSANHMECLDSLYKIYAHLGDTRNTLKISHDKDSLMAVAGKPDIAFKYYISRGDEAKKTHQYALAEKFYLKAGEKIVATSNPSMSQSTYYSKMCGLCKDLKKYDEAIKYAELTESEFQNLFSSNDPDYYLPYNSLADLYKLKGDSVKAFEYVDSLFLMSRYTKEPRDLQLLYTTRGLLYSWRT